MESATILGHGWLPQLLQAVLALIFVLALIYGLYWAAQKIPHRLRLKHHGHAVGSLRVIQTLHLDPKKQLLVVQRGNINHLILSSAEYSLLIETYPDPNTSKEHE